MQGSAALTAKNSIVDLIKHVADGTLATSRLSMNRRALAEDMVLTDILQPAGYIFLDQKLCNVQPSESDKLNLNNFI